MSKSRQIAEEHGCAPKKNTSSFNSRWLVYIIIKTHYKFKQLMVILEYFVREKCYIQEVGTRRHYLALEGSHHRHNG